MSAAPLPRRRHRPRLLVLLLALALAAIGPTPDARALGSPSAGAAPDTRGLIESVTTDRSMYSPGAPVRLTVSLHNRAARAFTGDVVLSYTHLGDQTAPSQKQRVTGLAGGGRAELTFQWQPPARDFTGYRVQVDAVPDGGRTAADTDATAVDVSSDWRKFPRYGFVSEFGADVDAQRVIAAMNRYHLNGVQFYDWHWKHHRPYSPEASWPDIANRPVHRSTVQGLIDAAHQRGMVAMNYNLAYGGYHNYDTDGTGVRTEWGLFRDPERADKSTQDSHPLPDSWATNRLYLFDPSNPDWQRHINAEERTVFDNLDFDGWHIDTVGNRGFVYDHAGNPVRLTETYAPFTNAAKDELGRRMLFNNVGGHGLDPVAREAKVDFVYTEAWEWDGMTTYRDLASVTERVRVNTDKPTVIPAYMNRRYSEQTPSGTTREFNEHSVRLANAAILAAGGSHLEIGDGEQMLSKEYFPSKPLVMSPSLREATRNYYDFQVAYQNLLRDQTVPAGNRVEIEGLPVSADGRAGAIWAQPKSRPGQTVLHLLNLENNTSDRWRDDDAEYRAPDTFRNTPVKLYYAGALPPGAKLRHASPDVADGEARTLRYETGSDRHGDYVSFTLPSLRYWDMIWLDTAASVPTPTVDPYQRIEAEDYSFTNQVSVEPTQDAGGGQNLCCSDPGDYAAYRKVDFGAGAGSVAARVATASEGGVIELRIDRYDGPVVGRVEVSDTGGWQQWKTVTAPVEVRGAHDLYVTFTGDVGGIANLNWLRFEPAPSP